MVPFHEEFSHPQGGYLLMNCRQKTIIARAGQNIRSRLIRWIKYMVEQIGILLVRLVCRAGKPESWQGIRVVVPLLHGLGDTILTSGLLDKFSAAVDPEPITLLVNNRTADLFKNSCRQINIDKQGGALRLLSLRKQFDCLVSPARHLDHYLIALLLQPRFFWGYNLTHRITKGESHLVRLSRLIPRPSPQHPLPSSRIVPAKDCRDAARRLLDKRGVPEQERLIALLADGRWKSKTCSPDLVRQLTKLLSARQKVRILLLGSKSGEIRFDDLDQTTDLRGETPLSTLIGLLQVADCIICPDSGVLHLALALNRPVVGLFSSVDPATVVQQDHLKQMLFEKYCPAQPCYNEEHEPFCLYRTPLCNDWKAEVIIRKLNELYPALLD